MEELREALCKGVLADVFRISRLAGVAPFTLTQRGPIISRCLTLYSYILVAFINLAVLAGFAIDLLTEPSRSLRASTPTSRLVWIANFTIVILLATVSVYQGPSRIVCNINILEQIIKIKIFLGIKIKPDSLNKNQRLPVILISGGLCSLIFWDLYLYVIEALYRGKEVRTLLMYSFLYYEYILILLVELQFALLALELKTILQIINKGLKKKILYDLERDAMEELREALCKGVLADVFRISRLAGVAPFTLTQRGPIISRCLTLYSYILVAFINLAVLAGFAIDLLTEPSRSLRASTPTSRLVWIANFTIVILLATVSVYQGPSRIVCNINILEQIIKIKIFLGIKIKPDSLNKNQRLPVILISGGLCSLIFWDLYLYVIEALYRGKEVRTLLMYSFLYYEYILILLVELQFALLALELKTILQIINKGLKKKILYDLERDEDEKLDNHSSNSDQNEINAIDNCVNRPQSIKRTKSVVDFVAATIKFSSNERKIEVPDKYKSIKDFSVAYGAVCDVLRQLDQGHGLVLLLIIVSCFLELVITPYYMITSLYSSMDWRANVILQFFWCIFHICDMLFVVEPCHRTQEEMDQTQVLVCLMMRTVPSTNDPMHAELDLFSKQLMLNRPSYSPLGMCTMSRPLIVTIIGAVTTYLVIIFQFRTFETNLKS